MPTARIGGNDDVDLHIRMYKQASSEGFNPILYVTPQIIKEINKSYTKLDSIKFIGVKIHPDAIAYCSSNLISIVDFAYLHGLPLFIHTGGKSSSEAIRFESIIRNFPTQIFVLCHARPANQAFYLMNRYSNVWIDTAFLPLKELKVRINENNRNRILFGTDYPVNKWYPELPDDSEWYASLISDISTSFIQEISADILYNNYQSFRERFSKTL